jgi:hypothetical protein
VTGQPGCHSQGGCQAGPDDAPWADSGQGTLATAGWSRENLGHGQTDWAGLPWPGPDPGPRCQGGPGPPDPGPGHPRPGRSRPPQMAGRLASPPAFSGPAFFAKTGRHLAALWPGQRRRPLPRMRPAAVLQGPGRWGLAMRFTLAARPEVFPTALGGGPGRCPGSPRAWWPPSSHCRRPGTTTPWPGRSPPSRAAGPDPFHPGLIFPMPVRQSRRP